MFLTVMVEEFIFLLLVMVEEFIGILPVTVEEFICTQRDELDTIARVEEYLSIVTVVIMFLTAMVVGCTYNI